MKTKTNLLLLLAIMTIGSQALACTLAGTELGNHYNAGTELGNGGDGVLFHYANSPSKVQGVYLLDLYARGLLYIDKARIKDTKTVIDSKIKAKSELATKNALLSNPQGGQRFDSMCFERDSGFCAYSAQDNAPKGQPYYAAIADAMAYHLSLLEPVSSVLVTATLNRLNKLRFEFVDTGDEGLSANPDSDREFDSSLLKKGGERIGCARHTSLSDVVEWGSPCLTAKMPNSHAAGLLVHEAIYALLIDSGKIPSEATSAQVRDVVAEIFSATPTTPARRSVIQRFVGLMNSCGL